MFGNLIYYDKSKIEQYIAYIIGNIDNGNIASIANQDDTAANKLIQCSYFEKLLQQREDYYDFIDYKQEINIKDIKVSSIIKVRGEVQVPEQFDFIKLLDEYKYEVLSAINYNDNNNLEKKEILKKVMLNSKIKIPLFCELGSECDYWLGVGKLIPDNLLIEYSELEDCEGKEFTILSKIESRKYYNDKSLPVFNIYKDFLGLNRAFRKQIKTTKRYEYESIEVEEDYLGLEILAIY